MCGLTLEHSCSQLIQRTSLGTLFRQAKSCSQCRMHISGILNCQPKEKSVSNIIKRTYDLKNNVHQSTTSEGTEMPTRESTKC